MCQVPCAGSEVGLGLLPGFRAQDKVVGGEDGGHEAWPGHGLGTLPLWPLSPPMGCPFRADGWAR